jgi:hypothetical protein
MVRVYFMPTMSATVTATKKKTYSKASLEAGDRLLRAIKDKLLREKGRIDYASLRREGYSDTLIARLKAI